MCCLCDTERSKVPVSRAKVIASRYGDLLLPRAVAAGLPSTWAGFGGSEARARAWKQRGVETACASEPDHRCLEAGSLAARGLTPVRLPRKLSLGPFNAELRGGLQPVCYRPTPAALLALRSAHQRTSIFSLTSRSGPLRSGTGAENSPQVISPRMSRTRQRRLWN